MLLLGCILLKRREYYSSKLDNLVYVEEVTQEIGGHSSGNVQNYGDIVVF